MKKISLAKLLVVWTVLLVWTGFFCLCDVTYEEPYHEMRGCLLLNFSPVNVGLGVSWAGPAFRHKYGPDVTAWGRGYIASIYWGTYGFNPKYSLWKLAETGGGDER